MADSKIYRMNVMAQGSATVRQRPSLLLMIVRLKAAEPTLELGLAKLKRQCEAAQQWLKRLGAESVEFGNLISRIRSTVIR